VSSPAERTRGRGLPPVLVPWLAYLGVTLAVPAVNGAWRREGFGEHAVITLVVSGAIVGVWLVLGRRFGRCAS